MYQYFLRSVSQGNIKTNKWDLIKLKSFCIAKTNKQKKTKQKKKHKNHKKPEKTTYGIGENSYKLCNQQGYISQGNKQLIQLNKNNKKNNPMKKWAVNIASKKTNRWPTDTRKDVQHC